MVEGSTGMISVSDVGVIDLVQVSAIEEGYRKILDQEVDVFVFDYPSLAYQTGKLRAMGHPVMIFGAPFSQEFYAVPMSLQLAAREPNLMGKINAAIFALYDEKYLDRLRQKWLSILDVR